MTGADPKDRTDSSFSLAWPLTSVDADYLLFELSVGRLPMQG